MKKTQTENVILESYQDIELLVTYEYETTTQVEDFHGKQELSYTSVEITYVELVIAGEQVKFNAKGNILPHLTKKQIETLESELQILN
jgi:hypothetical protein